jgi:hypothetical protein
MPSRGRDHDVENPPTISGSSAESLVEQHDDRVHAQRARDRDPLLLTAGELARVLVLVRDQADAVEHLHAARQCVVLRAAEDLDLGERQVLRHGQMREQLEVLEHHADARAQLRQVGLRVRDRGAVDDDVTLLERLERVDGLDQRRLARPRGAADDDDLALPDGRRAVGQHLEAAVPLGNVLDVDHGKAFAACPEAASG